MVRHLTDPDLLVEVTALETEEMHRFGRQVKPHAVEDLLAFRFRGEELWRLDIPTEDWVGERRRRLLGSMNDDLNRTGSNLVDAFPDTSEVRVEEERLPNGLVVDRRVREADLEGSKVAFAN